MTLYTFLFCTKKCSAWDIDPNSVLWIYFILSVYNDTAVTRIFIFYNIYIYIYIYNIYIYIIIYVILPLTFFMYVQWLLYKKEGKNSSQIISYTNQLVKIPN